jgi:hypothetical protein
MECTLINKTKRIPHTHIHTQFHNVCGGNVENNISPHLGKDGMEPRLPR